MLEGNPIDHSQEFAVVVPQRIHIDATVPRAVGGVPVLDSGIESNIISNNFYRKPDTRSGVRLITKVKPDIEDSALGYREAEAIILVAAGLLTNEEAAVKMKIEANTVRTMTEKAQKKLGVSNRQDALEALVGKGIVDIDEIGNQLDLELYDTLTPAEVNVFKEWNTGEDNELEIEYFTIRTHLANIYKKLKLKGPNRRVLLRMFYLKQQRAITVQADQEEIAA